MLKKRKKRKKQNIGVLMAMGDPVDNRVFCFLYLYVRALLQKLVGKSVELLQCALLHCRFHSDNRLQYAYVLEGL